MGRNKIKIEKIQNERIRKITFCKRKRGLLNKARELAVLCDVKIMIFIVDSNEDITLYSSEKNYQNIIDSFQNQNIFKEVVLNNNCNIINKGIKDSQMINSSEIEKENEDSNCNLNVLQKNRLIKIINIKFLNNESNTPKIEGDGTNLQNNLFDDRKCEEGLSKIKKRLSLKVVIPENKNKLSFVESNVNKSIKFKDENYKDLALNNKNMNESKNSINNYLPNINPLANFSENNIQNLFIQNIKDNYQNIKDKSLYNLLSPIFSCGSLKVLSPYNNSFNPTPFNNKNTAYSNIFAFNNSPSGTPQKGINNQSNVYNNNKQMCGINTYNNIIIIPSPRNLLRTNDEICKINLVPKENLNDCKINNNNLNILNDNPIIIDIPNTNLKEESNLISLKTPGLNHGFYSWVINGSPVLKGNVQYNNIEANQQTGNKLLKNKRKMKKN